MKNITVFGMVLLLIFALAGCGTKNKTTNETDQGTATNNAENTDRNNAANDNAANDNAANDENADHAAGTEEHKIDIAEDAANNVTKLEGVENANVLVTNRNAYVGVMLKEGVQGNKEMENKIAEEVRSADANIDNVYVSLNPDFAKQMTEYRDKIRAGEPVSGFFQEFTDAMKRVFPDAH